MDSCLQQAIDLVATDGAAIRHVLDAVQHVQIGSRKFGSISRGWNDPLETTTDAAADEGQHAVISAPLVRPADQDAEPDDDADRIDGDEGAQLDSIVQSLAKHLSTATSNLADEELRDILRSLRLSAGFFSELADANDGWQSTTSKMAFHAAMQRYRQAHDRMTTSNLKLVLSIAKKYVTPVCRWRIWFRKETLASSKQLNAMTGGRGSGSQPLLPGGSGNRFCDLLPTRAERSDCQCMCMKKCRGCAG
jgi:hypothetical protein